MRTMTIVVIALALAAVGAMMLAGRSARTFMQEKKRRRGRHPIVKLPSGGDHGKRGRKR